MLPTRERVGSVVSIVIYAAFAVVALERSGLIWILASRVVAVVAMWVIAAYLLLSVLPNLASKSKYVLRASVACAGRPRSPCRPELS